MRVCACRWPWLAALRQAALERVASGRRAVVSCSALKKSYRDALRGADGDPRTGGEEQRSPRIAFVSARIAPRFLSSWQAACAFSVPRLNLAGVRPPRRCFWTPAAKSFTGGLPSALGTSCPRLCSTRNSIPWSENPSQTGCVSSAPQTLPTRSSSLL